MGFFEPSVMGGGGGGGSESLTLRNQNVWRFACLYIYETYNWPHLTSKFRLKDQNWGPSFMS